MSSGGRYLNNNRGGHTPKQPRRGMNKGLKIILIILIVLAVIIGACFIGFKVYTNYLLGHITRPEWQENEMSKEEVEYWATYNPDAENEATIPALPDSTAATTEPATEATTAPTEPQFKVEGDYITNIMLVGQSYREGEETKLADSMILCSINRKTNTLTMTSFLRDTYIQMPNFKGHTCGMNRINVVYNLGWRWAGELGGMEMLALCLKNNFGIEVDYTVEINFDAFYAVIDALGGVDVELTESEVAYLHGFENGWNDYVQVGPNHLNGYTALCYARARKVDATDNDIKRTARQRYLLTALMDQVKGMGIKDVNNLAKEVLPHVITDMTNDEITGLIFEMLPMLPKLKVEMGTCPAEGTSWGEIVNIGGYDSGVIRFDLPKNKEILQSICEVPAEEPSK